MSASLLQDPLSAPVLPPLLYCPAAAPPCACQPGRCRCCSPARRPKDSRLCPCWLCILALPPPPPYHHPLQAFCHLPQPAQTLLLATAAAATCAEARVPPEGSTSRDAEPARQPARQATPAMSKGQLGDYLFKGAVTVLAGGSLLAGISVAISMADRFAFHRQVRPPACPPACAHRHEAGARLLTLLPRTAAPQAAQGSSAQWQASACAA